MARGKIYDTLVIPNFNDMAQYNDADFQILAPTESFSTVMRAIAKSNFVVGSSLHAVVVADSLGVPARLVASEHEDGFKYRDYLAGTGRPTTQVAKSVRDAIDLGPHGPPEVDLDALERAFPWDLWGSVSDEVDPPDVFAPDALQGDWLRRIANKNGMNDVIRYFIRELLPQVRAAAIDNSPDLESQLSYACDYLTEVAPEAVAMPLVTDALRVREAIEARDIELARFAALLGESTPLAMLRCARLTSRHVIVETVLHGVSELATASSVDLVLTGQTSDRVVRESATVSEVQRKQWHVDLEVMIDWESLSHDSAWTLAVEIDGPECASLEVLSVRPESLELLALDRGNLPTSTLRATISREEIRYAPSFNVGSEGAA